VRRGGLLDDAVGLLDGGVDGLGQPGPRHLPLLFSSARNRLPPAAGRGVHSGRKHKLCPLVFFHRACRKSRLFRGLHPYNSNSLVQPGDGLCPGVCGNGSGQTMTLRGFGVGSPPVTAVPPTIAGLQAPPFVLTTAQDARSGAQAPHEPSAPLSASADRLWRWRKRERCRRSSNRRGERLEKLP
jgi:hypothetical protein